MADYGEKTPIFRVLPLVQPNPDGKPVDIAAVKTALKYGLSDAPYEDRCYAWLVVLGVFPNNPNDWPNTRQQIVTLYDMLVKEYKMEDWIEKVLKKHCHKDEFELEEKSTIALIHTDIVRTGRHIYFMPPDDEPLEPVAHDMLLPFSKTLRRLERILYVFACCNPNYGYMQGFNELVAPLFYVIQMAKQIFDDEMEMEAMTYMLFTNLITNTSINEFYDTKDKSAHMESILRYFGTLLHKFDPKTAAMFDSIKLEPVLYAFRWCNLIFAQEHDLPSLLIIWDSCFAYIDDFSEYVLYVGVAHIKAIENRFTETEFSAVLEEIQNMKDPDSIQILKDANKMWEYDQEEKRNAKKKGKKFKF